MTLKEALENDAYLDALFDSLVDRGATSEGLAECEEEITMGDFFECIAFWKVMYAIEDMFTGGDIDRISFFICILAQLKVLKKEGLVKQFKDGRWALTEKQ